MADDTAAPATGAPTQNAPENDTSGEDLLGDAGKRAIAAERQARREAEARLKELEPLAAKAREMEEASKSEQQKLMEQLEALKSEGANSARELTKLQVALDKAPESMPLARVRKLAARLKGDDREALEADAQELFAEFAPPAPAGGRRPTEALPTVPINTGGQGGLTDMNDWMRAKRAD